MAVLANDPAAPRDLREKSLRLAAHLLEYDPKLRGGTGYARARELLDSGAALKQMQKIIEAQGPSGCSTDLGNLTFDVTAGERRRRRRHRLPAVEPAGADRGRADRQGRRHQDCSRRSATASKAASRSIGSTPSTSRNTIWRRPARRPTPATRSKQPSPPGDAVNSARHPVPAVLGAGDARRLAARLGLALHEIARAPVSRRRIARDGRAGRVNHHHLCLARSAERQAAWRSCSPPKRCGAPAQSGWCWWRPISATCARMRPSTKAKRSARRRSAGCSRESWIA